MKGPSSLRASRPELIVALLLVAGACGKSSHTGMNMDQGSAKTAQRTVNVDMVDVAFKPTTMTAHKGETVKFVFHNRGKVNHEALFGDAATQDAHEHDMNDMNSAGHGMSMTEVTPGGTKSITYTFDKAGTTLVGCHETGHYAAGMKITVTVT